MELQSKTMKDIDFNALVAEATLKMLDEEKKDALIKAALESLITSKDTYSKKTKLQEIFEVAVYEIAKQKAKELVSNSEVQIKIGEIIQQGLEKMLKDDKLEELTANIADLVVRAFKVSPQY